MRYNSLWSLNSVLCAVALTACAVRAQYVPPPTNPFCGTVTRRNDFSLSLICESGMIESVLFAAYGTPTGSCQAFEHNSACDAPGFAAYANSTCVGKPSCTLESASQADPCSGVIKSIYAVAQCTILPGGYATTPQPSPSCALNGQPCPPPLWEPTWNLTQSTVIQPWCNVNNRNGTIFDPAHPWGLISLAWDCAASQEEAATVPICAKLKAEGKATRCFMYHNQELALGWLESQAAVMYDPSKIGYFMRWPNGSAYNEPGGMHNDGDQYFWNFTAPGVSEYFTTSVSAVISDPAIDGTFADDVTGIPAEHPAIVAHLNLSQADVSAHQWATQAANSALISSLAAQGKYVWQAFGSQDSVLPGPSPGDCSIWMQQFCDPARQGAPLMMAMDIKNRNQSVAAFLVVRPPYGYIGWGWYSDDTNWDDIFLLDVGEPLGLCAEGSPGVFSRTWTKGIASLDCNTWEAVLPM